MRRLWPMRPGARAGTEARRLRAERGLTIVEVMVAAMVLVIGALAIFKIVDAATRTSYRAEQSQVVSNLLQRELERVKSLAPAQMIVQEETVESCLGKRTQAALEGDAGPAEVAPIAAGDVIKAPSTAGAVIVPCEEMAVSPGEGADSSDVRVTVYRFVTWYDPDFNKPELGEKCAPPPSDGEPLPENVCGMRRITVGVKPEDSGPGGERTYKEIQSDVVNVLEDPGDGG